MYTELHLHTSYSFLDGASQPEELVLQAQALGYTALAITDHDGLSGAMEFAQAARAAHLQPIVGAEITLADGSHLTLLAETRTGYGNLCRLITASKHGTPPLPVSLDAAAGTTVLAPASLADYAKGLILLTGCRQGQLARLVDAGRLLDAERVLRRYAEWFGRDNVFVELQQHRVYGDTPRIRHLVALAARVGLPIVATGNVHYHHPERHRLQDVLVAIRHRTTLDQSHQERRPNAEWYLHRPDAMTYLFRAYPAAIANTQVIARRCASFDLTEDLGYTFPTVATSTQESQNEYLARICHEAFAERYPETSAHRDRANGQLQDELRLIAKHALAGFFLTYRDLLIMAREVAAEVRGYEGAGSRSFLPPGRGRGSAVSSIVCYLIGLSPVDPLAHHLYVGRFLNEDLQSVPDIDIDFPREIRERLIERVYDAYGRDHVALVGAFATYRLPSAVRDVGKALGLPRHELDRIARLAEPASATALAAELARMPEYAA
ncbi:MAG: PHP domain-containing protein, partial [Thermomicrobiales bacterium]